MVVMLITEAATQSLVSIWFAIGALAALLAAVFGCTLPVQTAIFFFVSGILMAFLLPVARKKLAQVKTATNADRILEKNCGCYRKNRSVARDRTDSGYGKHLVGKKRG